MFSKVLIGVDGHEGGRRAIDLARTLAPEAVLVLAHAYPYDDAPGQHVNRRYSDRLRGAAERLLARERAAPGVTALLAPIGDTSAARALHRLAESLDADLIVAGSTRSGPGAQVLLGDVARSVLTHAPCAVAIAPRTHAPVAAGFPRGIAVGFDGSPEAEKALQAAVELARKADARLRLCWSIAPPGPASAESAGEYDWAELGERAYEGAEADLARVLSRLDVPAEGSVATGRAAERLEELSRDVDLLVVGSRGWGPLRRVLLGSTSDHLAYTSACPLLVMPRPPDAPGLAAAPRLAVEDAQQT